MVGTAVFAANKTALITGGAGGVGYAVAQLCRKHGMKLALVDYNAENLAKAKEELNSSDVETYHVDVSKLDQWQDLKAKVDKQFGGKLDLLMLNAGVSAKPDWESNEYFHKILDTNLFGVVNGITTFVPSIRANKDSDSAIIITGSKQGITNPPGNPAYNASKAAVKSIAEGLSWEMRDTKTSVHLLVPGWTYTGLTKQGGATEKPAGAWDPSQVADYLYKKMSDDKFYIICPDNEVTEDKDKRRILWAAREIIDEKPPLSRWRAELKVDAEKWMQEQKL